MRKFYEYREKRGAQKIVDIIRGRIAKIRGGIDEHDRESLLVILTHSRMKIIKALGVKTAIELLEEIKKIPSKKLTTVIRKQRSKRSPAQKLENLNLDSNITQNLKEEFRTWQQRQSRPLKNLSPKKQNKRNRKIIVDVKKL
jgi:hypothetical protein